MPRFIRESGYFFIFSCEIGSDLRFHLAVLRKLVKILSQHGFISDLYNRPHNPAN